MDRYSRVYAAVNLDALKENMKAMKANLPEKTGIIGVLKADGYGHGAVPVAKAIEPYVEGYAVAAAEEGLNLCRHGVKKPILILGPVHPCWYDELIEHQIRPVLFEEKTIREFSARAAALKKRAPFHLALDTGMSRIGMKPDQQSAELISRLMSLPGIYLEGMFTHFATADEEDKTKTMAQIAQYQAFVKMLEKEGVQIPIKHCANSAGIIDSLGVEFDLVRAGISIYGLYPSREVNREAVKLTPALELKSHVTYIKSIEPGTEISYGGTFKAEVPMRIATIPAGYGDGYPRYLSGKGWVLIRGQKAPVVGRICMDQFMVDITGLEGIEENDQVTLIGKDGDQEITAEDLAEAGGGFHYELLCGLGKRVPRIYFSGGKAVGKKDYFDDRYQDFEC